MKNYSIMPMNVDYIEGICEDIKQQYENKGKDHPLGKL